jgi:hypothetical protein
VKRILISVIGVFVMAGCSVNSNDLNSPGEVQSALDDASIACEEASVQELPWDAETILMVCKDGSTQQRTYSFLIWESSELSANAIEETCKAPFSTASQNELISTTNTVIAQSDSLLVDADRISQAISGKTSTWMEYCSERGFTPTIEKIQEESTQLPNVEGTIFEEAKDFLEANGWLVLRVFEKSVQPEGVVVRMEPEAGTSVAEGTAITLYVSSGD